MSFNKTIRGIVNSGRRDVRIPLAGASVDVRELRLHATYHHAIEVVSAGQGWLRRRLLARWPNKAYPHHLDLRYSRVCRDGGRTAERYRDRRPFEAADHDGPSRHPYARAERVCRPAPNVVTLCARQLDQATDQGLACAFRDPWRFVALPALCRRSEPGNTTLTVPLGWYGLTVATVLGINDVVDPVPVGSSFELHSSASGLALLAFLPKGKAERYVAWVQKNKLGQDTTIHATIAEVRAQGYALSSSELETRRRTCRSDPQRRGESLASIAVRGRSLGMKSNRPKILASAVAAARRIEGMIQLDPARFPQPLRSPVA